MSASAQSIGPLSASLHVGLGGAIGAVLRYQVGKIMDAPAAASSFPWATLTVNVLGSLVMGLLLGWLARGDPANVGAEPVRLLLGVGVLGGFTTFSTFSLEMMVMVERGQPALAMFYATFSIVAGLAGLYLGLALARMLGQG